VRCSTTPWPRSAAETARLPEPVGPVNGPLRPRRASLLLLAAALSGAAAPGTAQECRPTSPLRPLPSELSEASGAAFSRYHPDVIWTHNDGGHAAALFAVDPDGRFLGRVVLDGSINRDWEDIETAPCASGNCLYLADTGDNAHRRGNVTIYRLPEPEPAASSASGGEVLLGSFPSGPRDVEALFVLPGERIYLVTKGSRDPVEVYRFPVDSRFARVDRVGEENPSTIPVLELVQVLDERRRSLPRQVTGASASPSGDKVVIRTYETLEFFHVRDGGLVPTGGGPVNLRPLRESQGEGIGWGFEDRIALTSEAGPFGGAGSLALLTCRVPATP
jgi:hypothetical protein